MKVLLHVLLLSIFGLLSASTNYPINIGQPGYFVVNKALIAEKPPNALPIPAQKSSLSIVSKMFSTKTISENCFCEFQLSELMSGNGHVTHAGEAVVVLLKTQCDRFNRCILEGLDYRRAIIFGSVFLRLFKAAYPGLRNVHIYKEEIVELVSMAIEKFSVDPSNERHQEFLKKCLKFYLPDYVPSLEHAKSFQFIRTGLSYSMKVTLAEVKLVEEKHIIEMKQIAFFLVAVLTFLFSLLLAIIIKA